MIFLIVEQLTFTYIDSQIRKEPEIMSDSPLLFDPMMLGKRAQRIRTEKKISIETLARQANVNKNTVVRFEKGIPTRIDTIYKICSVLGVSPLKLIEGGLIQGRDYDIKTHQVDENGRRIPGRILRKDRIQSDDFSGMVVGDLNYHLPGGHLVAKVLEVTQRGELHTHSGEEFLFCLTGTVGVQISDIEAVLNKGDAIFFWGTEPHLYYNADSRKKTSVALTVVCGAPLT